MKDEYKPLEELWDIDTQDIDEDWIGSPELV